MATNEDNIARDLYNFRFTWLDSVDARVQNMSYHLEIYESALLIFYADRNMLIDTCERKRSVLFNDAVN